MTKRSTTLFGLILGALALVNSSLVQPVHADVATVSDVSAGVVAPALTEPSGALSVVGSIRNSGALDQPAGSTLKYTVTSGTITGYAGCAPTSPTVATCVVGALNAGKTETRTFVVAANPGAKIVHSQVDVTAAQLESNILDFTNNTASADTAVAYNVNASLTNNPDTVRNGADTLLTATVTNTQAPQTVNVTLASGGTIDTAGPGKPDGCTSSGANLTCAFVLATGESKIFDTAVTAPTSGSSMTSTLTATGASGGDTKTVSVSTSLSSGAQAFVPAGGHLAYSGSNQYTDFQVPVGSAPGTFLNLGETTLNNVKCGAKNCIKQAAQALFPNNGYYSGTTKEHPFIWDIRYNVHQSCNSLSDPAGCFGSELYWIPSGATAAQQMKNCPTYGSTNPPVLNDINEPCLAALSKGGSGFITYKIALLRDIVIPIISVSTE